MPCTLNRKESWLLAPRFCHRCSKIPQPKSVKHSLHRSCEIISISTDLSHKQCFRKQVKLDSQLKKGKSQKQLKIFEKAKSLNPTFELPRKRGRPRKQFTRPFPVGGPSSNRRQCINSKKYKKMSDSCYTSDSGESVILVTDDEDEYGECVVEKKILPGDKNVKSVEVNQAPELDVNQNHVSIKVEAKDTKFRSSIEIESSKVCAVGPVDTDEEEEQFEERYRNDRNFVLAKFVTRKKRSFTKHKKVCKDKVEERLKKVMDRADIIVIKKTLDEFTSSPLMEASNWLINQKRDPAVTAQNDESEINEIGESESRCTDEVSESRVGSCIRQMPKLDEFVLPESVPLDSCIVKKKTRSIKPLRNRIDTVVKKVPRVLKPEMKFPSLKMKSFKIPRAKISKDPTWIKNGSLWQWALTVDDKGQYSRTDTGRKKVSWYKLISKRPCNEFQMWLKRGTYEEGDQCSWAEDVFKDADSTSRRREEFLWKEQMTQSIRGSEKTLVHSSRSCSGLFEEEDSGNGSWESMSEMSIQMCVLPNDLVENELNVSQQSMVTHIRSPTHNFIVDENDSTCDNMFQEIESNVVTSQTQPESLVAPLPDADVKVMESYESSTLHEIRSDQPFPSPPPSLVPVDEVLFSNSSARRSSEGTVTAHEVQSTVHAVSSRDMSMLVGLVSSKSNRLKLF